jgi:AcrR family transcriptional regulator
LEKEIKNDPRSKRTRRLLQDALTDLMHKKKFHEISVQDIATQAEINRATFYAHFVDKYELLNMQIRDSFQTLLDENLPEQPAFTIENLRILSLTAHQYLSGFPDRCTASTTGSDNGLLVQQVQRQIQMVILKWLQQTPTRPTSSPLEVTAMVISWAIFGAILEVAWNSRKISSDQLTTQVLALLEPGLRADLVAETAR